MLRGWALVTLAATGCSFHGSYDGTSYQCGAGDTCPTGQTCVANQCVVFAAADAPVNAPPDAAVAGQPGCGSVGLLVDAFDGAIFPLWAAWSDGAPTATITGGRLVVHIPTGNGAQGAGLMSRFYYDLTNSQVEATVSQVGGTDTILEVRALVKGKLQMVVENGQLYAAVFGVTGGGTRAQVTYDPSTHKHWRIRENSGVVYWEWSVDAITWNELWHEADPIAPADVMVQLSANGSLASTSEAHFDELDVGGPAVPGFCPASAVSDDFSTGSFGPTWVAWNDTPSTIAETGGKAVLAFPSPGTGDIWAGIQTNHLFDLRTSTVYVDVPSPPQVTTFVTFFQIASIGDTGNQLEFNQEGNQLQMNQFSGGSMTSSTTITYDSTAHRYWRFRGAGGKVYWDASPDAVTWTQLKAVTPTIDLSAVLIAPGAGHYPPGPGVALSVGFGSVSVP